MHSWQQCLLALDRGIRRRIRREVTRIFHQSHLTRLINKVVLGISPCVLVAIEAHSTLHQIFGKYGLLLPIDGKSPCDEEDSIVHQAETGYLTRLIGDVGHFAIRLEMAGTCHLSTRLIVDGSAYRIATVCDDIAFHWILLRPHGYTPA